MALADVDTTTCAATQNNSTYHLIPTPPPSNVSPIGLLIYSYFSSRQGYPIIAQTGGRDVSGNSDHGFALLYVALETESELPLHWLVHSRRVGSLKITRDLSEGSNLLEHAQPF